MSMYYLPWQRMITAVLYTLSVIIGVAAFAYPFVLPGWVAQTASGETTARATDAPLLTLVLMVMCLAVLLIEMHGQAVSAKMVAVLGVLVAMTAVLRFVDSAVPLPGGFSPIFTPIILAGYVFGARFGFLMGTMTLLVSALITGGVGPWLPYQMFVTGWVGLTAGWLPHPQNPKTLLGMLLVFGFGWGVLFGALMNLYFWPFVSGEGNTFWQPGSGLWETIGRYAAFYALTSLWWDVVGAIGNVVLMAALGLPVVRAFTRFRDRFQFTMV